MAERGRRSRILRTLLLVAVQIIATFLLLEVALRLIRPHNAGLNNLLYLPSVSTNYSRVNNTADLIRKAPKGFDPGGTSGGFVLNSRGLRTHEYAVERSGGLRVIAIGDSFTWGVVPHRQTWPFRLQAALRHTLDRRDIEVISLGVPGAGPKFYLRMWELEGRRLAPDLVVLGFFVGNDLQEKHGVRSEVTRTNWVVEKSLTVRAIRNLVLVASSGMPADEEENIGKVRRPAPSGRVGYELPGYAASFDPARATMSEDTFARIEWNRMALCLRSNRPKVRRLVRRIGPVLEELDRSVRNAGAELLVFLIPDEFQVNDELSGRLLAANDTDEAEFDRNAPQRMLVKYLEDAGIHHVDGLQRFRARSKTMNLYLPRDTHWNAAGNLFAARMMVDYLQSSGILEETRGRE